MAKNVNIQKYKYRKLLDIIVNLFIKKIRNIFFQYIKYEKYVNKKKQIDIQKNKTNIYVLFIKQMIDSTCFHKKNYL
jgi:hypothetical protein